MVDESQDSFAVQNINQQAADKTQADLTRSARYSPFTIRQIKIPLDNGAGPGYGNPVPIPFPFKGVFVRTATDTTTNVNLGFDSDSDISVNNGIQLFINDGFQLPRAVAKGFLSFPAQPGKSMTLYFIVDGEFRAGSQISVNAGGVSINEGSSITTANVTVAATATLLAAADPSRSAITIQNQDATAIYIGGTNTVTVGGVNGGFQLPPGGVVKFNNTAAIYAICEGSGSNNQIYTVVEK